MALDLQKRTRRDFWGALLSLPITVTVISAFVVLRESLSEGWLVGILIVHALIFLLAFMYVIWILLFRRSRTGFSRWSVAFGLLGLSLVLALALAPVGHLAKHEEPKGEVLPPDLSTSVSVERPWSNPPRNSRSPQPEPTPSPPSNTVTVDDLISRMSVAPIAFDVPKAMQLEDSAEIKLLIGPGHDLKELIATLNKDAEGANIHITDRMEAHLSGTGFQITPVTPELQAVSRADLTSWQWEVKATEPGHHPLHLTLTAIFDLEGSVTPRAMKTFDRTIDVNVTFGRKIADFGRGNWQWLWATLLVPVGGCFMKKRSKARRLSRAERASRHGDAGANSATMHRSPGRR